MNTLPVPFDKLAELNHRYTRYMSDPHEWPDPHVFLPFKGQLHIATMVTMPEHILVTEVPGYLCMDWDEEQVIFLHRHVQLLTEQVGDEWYITSAFSHHVASSRRVRVDPDDYWVAVDPISWGRIRLSGLATVLRHQFGSASAARRYPPPRRNVAEAAFKRLRKAGPTAVAAARLGYLTKYMDAVPLPLNARTLAVKDIQLVVD